MEAGEFSPLGVFLTDFALVGTANGVGMTRLSSQLVHDFPDRMTTLVIGDSVSSGEMWGRPMYFAGVQYESKFSNPAGISARRLALGRRSSGRPIHGRHIRRQCEAPIATS